MEQLHRLLDSKAPTEVVHERMAGLMENMKADIARIGSDHEKRIRFIERSINWALGFVGAISAILYLISVFKR